MATAFAAKSLITRSRLSPKCVRTASIENVHGWFVSETWSPVIGEATANTACLGLAEEDSSSKYAPIASVRDG